MKIILTDMVVNSCFCIYSCEDWHAVIRLYLQACVHDYTLAGNTSYTVTLEICSFDILMMSKLM